MSNVDLRIGGRSYTVACAAGEEAHLAALGQTIDDKLAALGMAGQSETRQLLFAALMLADEVDEARKSGSPAPSPPPLSSDALPGQLEAIAERLEACAAHLES